MKKKLFFTAAIFVSMTVLCGGPSSVYALNPYACNDTNDALYNACKASKKVTGCMEGWRSIKQLCYDAPTCDKFIATLQSSRDKICNMPKTGIGAPVWNACNEMVSQWITTLGEKPSPLCQMGR